MAELSGSESSDGRDSVLDVSITGSTLLCRGGIVMSGLEAEDNGLV